MSKKVLGRGLGQLLPGQQPVPSHDLVTEKKVGDPSDLGPGLRVLVREKNGNSLQRETTGLVSRTSRSPVVRVSLILADVLFVALVLVWRGDSGERLGPIGALACVVALGFGAWLTSLAVWLHFGQK